MTDFSVFSIKPVSRREAVEALMVEVRESRAHKGHVLPIKTVAEYIDFILSGFEQHVIEQNKVTEIISTKTTVES